MLCVTFGWYWPSGFGAEDKMWKVYDNDDDNNNDDDGEQRTKNLTWVSRSDELKSIKR